MAMQLTPEQERRVRSFVDSGRYPSPHDVVDAALAAVEQQVTHDFEGTPEELEKLLLEGLNSGGSSEEYEDSWERVTAETNRIAAEQQARKLHS